MKSEIRMHHGRPTLWIDGKLQIPILFFGNTDIGTNVTEQAALAAKAGIHLHSGIYNLHLQTPFLSNAPSLPISRQQKKPFPIFAAALI